MEKPKIVILEGRETNSGDISWSPIEQLGELSVHLHTSQDQVIERVQSADVIITNKLKITRTLLQQLPNLKLICQLATGTDNIDKEAAEELGVEVKNAVGYSTHAVAQHTFALILELANQVGLHNEYVHDNGWTKNGNWSFWLSPSFELANKNIGIYGYGQIGRMVKQLAEAFEMKVLVNSDHGTPATYPDTQFVNLETLFSESDIVTLHKPLSSDNIEIVDNKLISKMKPTAFLINTGRGGLINENDLREALIQKKIAGAGLDVLSQEPPPQDHALTDLSNCIITPHMAWTPKETRERLIKITAKNIEAFLTKKNKV